MANLSSERNSGASALSGISRKVSSGENQIEHYARATGEKIGVMATEVADKTAEAVKSSREYIKEKPVRSVAMAAAAGVVAGGLLSMAMRRKKS